MEGNSPRANIDFDRLADELGGMSRYQISVYLLGCFTSFMAGIIAIITVFIAYISPYRCHVPECDDEGSRYEEPFLNFTIPVDGGGQEFSKCFRFEFQDVSNSSDPLGVADTCSPHNFHGDQLLNCSKWIYDTRVFTSTIVTTFDLVCSRTFLLSVGGSSYMVGMLIGASAMGVVSDKYGRKTGLLISTLLFSFCGIGSSLVTNYYVFVLLRAFTGAGGVGLFQVGFVIAVELIGSKWRTFCGIMIEVPFAVGEACTGVLAYFIRDWRWLQVACTAPGLLILSYLWIMPESVRWLVSQNRIDEASKIIDKAARVNNLPSPSYILKEAAESNNEAMTESTETTEKRSIFSLFRSRKMRNQSLILFFCWGVCTIAYYGLSSNTGNLSGNLFVNYILSMLIEIPAYIFTYYIMDRMGRKGTLMFVLLLAGVSCFASGLLPPRYKEWIVGLSLVGKFGVAAAFASIFVYTAELFPTEYRGVGLGACSTCARVGGILAPIFSNLSIYYSPLPLLIFGALSFLAGSLMLFLPETLGKDLPQTLEQSEKFAENQSVFYFTCCGSKLPKEEDSLAAKPQPAI